MKNKLLTIYLSSLIMLTSMGIVISYKDYSKVQYLDFTSAPIHITPSKDKK